MHYTIAELIYPVYLTIYTTYDMVYIMNRYQIYLDPKDVNILDELARLTNFSRSQIIRDVIDKMAKEYGRLLETVEKKRLKDNPLLKMAGFAKGPTKNISQNINEDYLID